MLYLDRKVDQRIIIETRDGPIEITLLDVKGRMARLSFQYPPEVEVYREEIHRRIQAERQAQGR